MPRVEEILRLRAQNDKSLGGFLDILGICSILSAMSGSIRAGIGFDIHRLVRGRRLMLGGVEIQSPVGLLGHSDGDALLHAICDALLGSCGLGDIGDHFPDTDARYAGMTSSFFLRECARLARRARWSIRNVDSVVFLEKPRLGPAKHRIAQHIADVLELRASRVNVKAKTMERLGPIGGRKAIAALAVATVVRL